MLNDKLSILSQKHPLTFPVMLLYSCNSSSPFPPSLPYLLVPFLSLLCEIDCAPLLSADAAVIEKHTLLRPLSLSPSLTLIGCLLEVTSPFFSACLPPPLFPPSLSLSSPQSQRILTIPLLYPPPFPVLYLLPLSSSSSLHKY